MPLDPDFFVRMFVVELFRPFEGLYCVFSNSDHLINSVIWNIHALGLQNSLQLVRISMNSVPFKRINIRHVVSILIYWVTLSSLKPRWFPGCMSRRTVI